MSDSLDIKYMVYHIDEHHLTSIIVQTKLYFN